jgi:hypothetical protein
MFLAVERSVSSSIIRPPPPLVSMASSLPTSCYQSENDLRVLRKAIGWQSSGYDLKMRCEMLSLAQPGDFVYFSTYALAGLVPPFSSFFLVLLVHYRLQLQHLSPHSITLVAIIAHFCEMFMAVRQIVRMFWWFHVLRPMNRHPPHLGGYYFQHRTKGSLKYLATLSPSRWEHWREDWVLVQADTHERLTLPTAAPTAPHADWEQDPGQELTYNPVLGRIQILAESGLTPMMVLHNYVSKRIEPLQECTRPSWFYTGVNDVTRLECGDGSTLSEEVLALVMGKLSHDPSSHDFVTPPTSCQPLCMDQAVRSMLQVAMPLMDDVDIAPIQRGDQSRGVQIPGAGIVGGQGGATPSPAPSKGKGKVV